MTHVPLSEKRQLRASELVQQLQAGPVEPASIFDAARAPAVDGDLDLTADAQCGLNFFMGWL